MSATEQYLANNARYAQTFSGPLPMPPSAHVAVVACMDARLNVYGILGLGDGEAHVIRNAGGRASDDAIRSLIISHKLQGTREWFVIHHTNCGQESFTDEKMRTLLSHSLETVELGPDGFHEVGAGPGSMDGEYIDWLTITNQRHSVVADVQRLRNHRLVPSSIANYNDLQPLASDQALDLRWRRPGDKAPQEATM